MMANQIWEEHLFCKNSSNTAYLPQCLGAFKTQLAENCFNVN